MRIVSLVPSLSHLLCELGLQKHIVGCTKFCVLPADLHRGAQLIGGTKDPNIDKIAALRPSHIIVNTEENKLQHREQLNALAPCLETFPKGPKDVAPMLRDIASYLNNKQAENMAIQCEKLLIELAQIRKELTPKTFLYFIWKNPYMVVGKDTYISRMLELVSWNNVCPSVERYPEVSLEQCRGIKADVHLFSSEPYPFRERDVESFKASWPKTTKKPSMLKVDGRMWSWYGALTLNALTYLIRYRAPVSLKAH